MTEQQKASRQMRRFAIFSVSLIAAIALHAAIWHYEAFHNIRYITLSLSILWVGYQGGVLAYSIQNKGKEPFDKANDEE